jgi:hypothetical protein
MKMKIINLVVGAIIALALFLLVSPVVLRPLFHDERSSSVKRLAHCQFLRVQEQLINDPRFWDNSYDVERWHLLIDINKVSCNSKMLIVDSRIFDITGAEIRLRTSSGGIKYLQRVKGIDDSFISLSSEHDKYEFPNPTPAQKLRLTSQPMNE